MAIKTRRPVKKVKRNTIYVSDWRDRITCASNNWQFSPADYEDDVHEIVNVSFDEMQALFVRREMRIAYDLDCLLSALRKRLMTRLSAIAKKWRPSKRNKLGVPQDRARDDVSNAIRKLFCALYGKVDRYKLADTRDANSSRVALHIEIMEESLSDMFLEKMESWNAQLS